MALSTHSRFYYGFEVASDSFYLDFDEGNGELTAQVEIGSYTPTDLADAIASALNDEAEDFVYTVTFNRSTRTFTIAADGNFDLLISSGTHAGASIFTSIGFTGADLTGGDDYTGSAAGSSYVTQFKLQDYVQSDNFQGAAEAAVNKAASGIIEIIKFGTELFYEFNFRWVTDYPMGSNGPIRNNATGVANLQSLMQYFITRQPFEFMPDENDTSTFISMILESTPEESKGTRYKIKELTSRNLPGVFETGVLKFRVIT